MNTDPSWHIIKSDKTKHALGTRHPNGSVNHVSAVVEKKSDSMWYWVVSARIIPAPFNMGMENTSFDAMFAADKAIKEYKEEGKILPCPFCGSENIHHENFKDSNWLRCQDCSATGGNGFDPGTALVRWNKRT